MDSTPQQFYRVKKKEMSPEAREFRDYCNDMMTRGFRCYLKEDFEDVEDGKSSYLGIQTVVYNDKQIFFVKDYYKNLDKR